MVLPIIVVNFGSVVRIWAHLGISDRIWKSVINELYFCLWSAWVMNFRSVSQFVIKNFDQSGIRKRGGDKWEGGGGSCIFGKILYGERKLYTFGLSRSISLWSKFEYSSPYIIS